MKAKSREEQPLKLLNIFVVVRYSCKRIIMYKVPNKVGKMTAKVYTEVILPQIVQDL
jgi:hypothetical protein